MKTFLVLLLATVAYSQIPIMKVTPNIPGQYIVVLEDDVNVADFAASMTTGTVVNQMRGILNAVSLKLDASALQKIQGLSGIKYIEEEGVAELHNTRSCYDTLWGLDRIDTHANVANNQITMSGQGAGSNVYIIDTGIFYEHQEFGGRAAPFFDYQGGNGADCHSHGTHCAGTAAGANAGVAPKANIFSVRVMSCSGSGSYSDIINGLNAVAYDSRPNRVASMSIGGGRSTSLNDAVKNAHARGVVVVTSAGNSNFDSCYYSPASAPEAVTVGATQSNDYRAYYSNYGTCMNIFAPGSGITSASHTDPTGYVSMSGTSMACPHVAGAAAAMLSDYGFQPADVTTELQNYSSKGYVQNPGTNSPNMLLWVA